MKTPVQKFNLRMPVPMMEQARAQAEALGISLNAYVLLAVTAQLGRTGKQLRPPAAASRQRATSVRTAPGREPDGAGHPPAASQPRARPGPGGLAALVGPNTPCPCGSGRKAKRCHPEMCGR